MAARRAGQSGRSTRSHRLRGAGSGAHSELFPRHERRALALAACHEVGNHLAAVRLSANLISRVRDVGEAVDGACTIEGVVVQAAALVGLVRSLLERRSRLSNLAPERVLEALRRELAGMGAEFGRVAIARNRTTRSLRADPSALQPLALALVMTTREAVGRAARVRVGLEETARRVRIWVEDEGPPLEPGVLRKGPPWRGRTLVLRIAAGLCREWGGRLELRRTGRRTRVSLALPAVGSAQPA